MVITDIVAANVPQRPRVSCPEEVGFDTLRDLVGHLYAEVAYRIVAYLHAVHSNKSKINKDGFVSVSIQCFGELLHIRPDHALVGFYRAQVEAVPGLR